MNTVKVISTEIDNLKRRVVKFLRMGKFDVQTSIEVSPVGIDSNPVKDMVAIYAETGIKGKTFIIGYLNKNQLADIGELRLYSTDADGGEKFYTWLKNDGTMEIGGNTKNMVRFQELKDGFDELKGDFNTFITAYNSHTHTGNLGAPTTPPASPGQPSTASIDDSKIDEIKTL